MRILCLLTLCSFLFTCQSPNQQNNYFQDFDSDNSEQFATDLEKEDEKSLAPQLMISTNGKSSPLGISKLLVNTKIVGSVAITTMDITFYNDYDRVLSGDLYFPLNEGQTISRFALEVDGKMRDAVPVEKEKGRVAYESTVRRKVDPGLAEITKGNNFKTRIYPIPSKSTKRLIIAYEQKLIHSGNKSYYRLPLYFNQQISDFQWDLNVVNDEKPKLEIGNLQNFKFENWEGQYSANFKQKDFTANEEFVVLIPKTERKALAESVENGKYFHLHIPMYPKSVARKISRESLTIVWDVSHSGSKRDSKTELEFLRQYLQSLNFKNLRLLCFANTILVDQSFSSAEKLMEEISKQSFDGASDFSSLPWDSFESEEVLIFSDFISTFSNLTIPTPNKPCYVFNSASGSDYSLQEFVSRKSGAKRIDLTKATVKKALSAMKSEKLQLMSIEVLEGHAEQLLPEGGAAIDQNFSVSGFSHSDVLKVKLNLGFGTTTLVEKIVEIDLINAYKGLEVAEKLWAQLKLDELNLDYSKNEEEIIALGEKFGLVSKNTSLIVLDNISDYVLHEITPPEALQEEYKRLLNQKEKVAATSAISHKESVLNLWQAKIAWWEKSFEIKKIKKPSPANLRSRISPQNNLSGTYDTIQFYDMDANGSDDLEEVQIEYAFSASNTPQNSLEEEPSYIGSASKILNQKGNSVESKIKKWEPDNAEFKSLLEKAPHESYAYYLELKGSNKMNAVFYSDAARVFMKNNMKNTALRVLSNLSELQYDDHEMLKVWANTLMNWKDFDAAVSVYNEILTLRGEEPQSYRDLGLALHKSGKSQEAIEMLYKVVETNWDGRFPEIETLVLGEINAIIQQSKSKLNTDFIDPKFLKNLPVDIRVVIDWDADNLDIDLWVTDPNGEKCLYSRPLTKIGGKLSRDFTGGYGPEEFLLKKAIKGKYIVEVNYFGSSRQRIAGPPNIKGRLISNYGRANESEKVISFRLKEAKQNLFIGEMIID